MSDEEEEEYIRKAVNAFKTTSPSGKVPSGVSEVPPPPCNTENQLIPVLKWFYGRPSSRSVHLVNKVYKDLGHEFLYWADTYADDVPYWTCRPGGSKDEGLLMMPYSLDCNDFKFWISHYTSDEAFEKHIIDAFTTLREEGLEGKPTYLTVALHSRWIGRPGRLQTLKRLIEYFNQFDDVWFATREQLAREWVKQHPYKPKTA